MGLYEKLKSQKFRHFILKCLRILPDKTLLKLGYRAKMHKKLNLKNPQTFNEKLQWLKLYDRKPIYTTMVDKYAVKQYVADIIGEEYIIPTLGVWDKFEDINFDALPNQFVLKCTHDSGGLVICKDKSKLDKKKARKKIKTSLKTNYYDLGREWPYKDVPRKIIAEKYMEDSKTQELRDYKFFCFNGEVKALFIASDRNNLDDSVRFDFFDENFVHLPIIKGGKKNSNKIIEKPVCFEKMKELASKLSKGIPHLRVDFYLVDNKIYFGELTFASGSGFSAFNPEEWDYTFGSWIELSTIK